MIGFQIALRFLEVFLGFLGFLASDQELLATAPQMLPSVAFWDIPFHKRSSVCSVKHWSRVNKSRKPLSASHQPAVPSGQANNTYPLTYPTTIFPKKDTPNAIPIPSTSQWPPHQSAHQLVPRGQDGMYFKKPWMILSDRRHLGGAQTVVP